MFQLPGASRLARGIGIYDDRKHRHGVWPACAAVLLLSACARSNHSALAPASGEASLIADLWWVMLAEAVFILAAVLLLLLIGVLRGRGRENRALNERQSRNLVLIAGVLVPVGVLLLLVAGSAYVGKTVIDETPGADVTVEVIGRRWWWEVHYLDGEGRRVVTTANEIHVPVGRRVRFLLKSPNVIHSFWVPNLQGKVDLIPGQVNTVSLVPKEAGVYRGLCAEFCGIQHAKMGFLVVAQAEEEFRAWLVAQMQPAREPVDALAMRGKQVFLGSACIGCHTVKGTPATQKLGPDLTHFASRRTLAAATLPNTAGHTGGWIAAPQHVKPGNLMPAVELEPEELRALIHYLQDLQ